MAEISTLNGYKIKDKKAIRFYNNINDMIADTSLKNGMYVKTSGYHQALDGGHGEYKIIDDNTLTDDSGSIIALQNGLFAILIINHDVSVNLFGAIGDGIANDSGAIQNAINFCALNNKTLTFINGKTYLVDTLNITNDINIEGNNCTLKSNGENVINIENTNLSSKYLKNIKIVDVPTNKIGIYCNPARRYVLDGISMSNISGTGIKVATYGGGILVNDYKIDGNPQSTNCVGLDVRGTSDGVYQNIIMTDVYTGLITNRSNIFNNIHPWIATASLFNGSKAFVVEGGQSLFNECYPDTYHYNFYISNDAFVNINQCKQYHNIYVANNDTISGAGGNTYALYYDNQATSKNTFIHNSFFQNELDNNIRYANQTNLEKPLYNIDRTTQWMGMKDGQGKKYTDLTFTPNDGFTVLKSDCKFNNNICWYNLRVTIGSKDADTDINIGTIDTNFLPPNEVLGVAYYGYGAFVIDGIALVRINAQGVVTIRLPETVTNNGTQVVFNISFFSTQQS